MSAELANVDVERLVRAVFRDEWMAKTGVGGVFAAGGLLAVLYNLSLLPLFVACWALLIGYSLRCMRVKIANPDAKLPDWNDWGDLFLSGVTWIALQTGLWLCFWLLQGFILLFCLGFAFNEKSLIVGSIWTLSSCVFFLLSLAVFLALSAYVMVNFAVEENARAGLAYIKVARSLFSHPRELLCGFLLALGVQVLFVLLPCATVVGIFVIPSSYFMGTILSSILIARHWSACNRNLCVENKAKLS